MTVHFDSAMHTDAAYVELYDVAKFYICDCELSVIFKENHQYKTMEEIDSVLNLVGIHIGNFIFKGVDAYRYDPQMPDEVYEEEVNKETSILCMIPENIRDSFSALVTD